MSDRPHILLITLDQFRADCLSALGHPCARTPHLDALAEDGVLFVNHYAQCAPCSPARASLYTGLYQMTHRVCRNGSPLDARFPTIATEARKAGYDPILFGYTDQSWDPRGLPIGHPILSTYEDFARGFAVHTEIDTPNEGWRDWLRAQGVPVPDEHAALFRPRGSNGPPRRPHREPPMFDKDQTETAYLTDRLLDHLRSKSSGVPLFLHVSHIRPHPPLVVPEPYNTLVDPDAVPSPVRAASRAEEERVHPYLAAELASISRSELIPEVHGLMAEIDDDDLRVLRAVYYGMIAEVDAQIGRALRTMKQVGLYEDAVIVVTSDHGEQLGDHHLAGKRGWFDQSYRVPLIVKPAGTAHRRGHRETAFTESVDVMPTLLELAGATVPDAVDGRSLVPLLRAGTPADWRREVRYEYDFRHLRGRLGLPLDACQMAVIRDHDTKYVHFTGLPPLLYDLREDPEERLDRADDPDRLSLRVEMAERMLSWRLSHADRSLSGWDLSHADGPRHHPTERGRW